MSLGKLLRSQWRISAAIAFVFLPWITVVLFTAGAWAALNFLGYAIVVFASGYCVIHVALPTEARGQALVLAPATGILVISALTALWVRLSLPLIRSLVLWFALTAAGLLSIWLDRVHWTRSTVSHGLTLALLSALVCVLYFLPPARNDLVQRPDGGFNWKFRDTQHFHAIAASIKNGGSPPKDPGTATADLLYHFAPYAPAAAISRFDGLDLGDAVARVTRGASFWALVLSCFGVGTLLSRRATGGTFGGIVSVAGFFFYGSVLSLFQGDMDRSGHWSGATLFTIPDVYVFGSGGPFIYLIEGHSLLHGLVAITAIMGLCLFESERESALTWSGVTLLALPALAVPMNSVAALYCFSIAAILLFWERLGELRSWLSILLMLCFFLAVWKLMGFDHSPDAAGAMINRHVTRQWWLLIVSFTVGLGFRIAGFRWITRPFKDPLSAMVLASVLGLLAFTLLLQLKDGNERYGILFLQSLFSIFAFCRLTPGCWRGVERTQTMAEWISLALKGMILLAGIGALMGGVAVLTHHGTGIRYFKEKFLVSLGVLLLLAATSALMKRGRHFATVGSAILMGELTVGFLAWTPDWLKYSLGRVKTDITYSPGEVRGLRRLGELMAPYERFATNKHALEETPPLNERSYGYSALSERPVLLEGYMDRGEADRAWFRPLLHDNDLLFTTTDPATLRDISSAWHVRWLVARPGTDVSLPRPLPTWLVEQQGCGELKIYRID